MYLALYFPFFFWLVLYPGTVVPVESAESENLFSRHTALPYQTDTMVNYCKLVRAGFFYGQKSTENKPVIDPADVDHFNAIWRDVFDVAYYQTGITANEFRIDKKFNEGNHQPFPPSVRYNPKNPDTYLLFHIAKEVGKIKSPANDNCPSCKKESIDKINELLKDRVLHQQVMQIWIGTSTQKFFPTSFSALH